MLWRDPIFWWFKLIWSPILIRCYCWKLFRRVAFHESNHFGCACWLLFDLFNPFWWFWIVVLISIAIRFVSIPRILAGFFISKHVYCIVRAWLLETLITLSTSASRRGSFPFRLGITLVFRMSRSDMLEDIICDHTIPLTSTSKSYWWSCRSLLSLLLTICRRLFW